MKKILAGLALGLASLAAEAALVEIVLPNRTVNIGDDVIVSIVGSGFADLMGGGVNLSFAPGVLELGEPTNSNITLAEPPWDGDFNRTEDVDDTAGLLSDFTFNQMGGISGSFPIARLTFRAKAPGVSNLSLFASTLFPFASEGGLVRPDFGQPVAVVVTPVPVPEPATWGVLATGLGLMILLGRKRSAASCGKI